MNSPKRKEQRKKRELEKEGNENYKKGYNQKNVLNCENSRWMGDKKAFKSNANYLLANSLGYRATKIEHVWGSLYSGVQVDYVE